MPAPGTQWPDRPPGPVVPGGEGGGAGGGAGGGEGGGGDGGGVGGGDGGGGEGLMSSQHSVMSAPLSTPFVTAHLPASAPDATLSVHTEASALNCMVSGQRLPDPAHVSCPTQQVSRSSSSQAWNLQYFALLAGL